MCTTPTPPRAGGSCAAPSECGMGVYKPLQVLIMGGHGLLWVADLPNLVMQAVPPLSSLLLVAFWAIHGCGCAPCAPCNFTTMPVGGAAHQLWTASCTQTCLGVPSSRCHPAWLACKPSCSADCTIAHGCQGSRVFSKP